MSSGKEKEPAVLGLRAKEAGDGDDRVVVGTGRSLRGRVVVQDADRQRVLFPPPSDATINDIRRLEAEMRRDDARLGKIRLD